MVGGDIATPDAIKYCKEIGVYTIMTNDIPYENNPYRQMANEAWEIPVEKIGYPGSKVSGSRCHRCIRRHQ